MENKKRDGMNQYDLLSPLQQETSRDFVQARGVEFTDRSGSRFIDMNDMCMVLGQGNEAYTRRLSQSLGGVTSGKAGFSPAKEQLYRYFAETTGGAFQAFHLTTSGSEAVEWAVRLAKKMTGRGEILSFWNSIHGRTYLSASLSGLPRRKTGYSPLAPGVVFAPYPNCAHCPLRAACKKGTFPCLEQLENTWRYASAQDMAAVIVEPYQGGGIIVPPEGYLSALYRWAKSHGMLFILDEIQSGMGRSGDLYCYQREDFCPDMLLLGKALGNGLHISALLMKDRPPKEALPAVSGGVGDDLLACTAACEVYRQLEDGLLKHVRTVGKVLTDGLHALEHHPCVAESRGIGLAAAIEFTSAAVCAEVCASLCAAGYFIGRQENAIYVKPPYVITEQQIRDFLAALESGIQTAQAKTGLS